MATDYVADGLTLPDGVFEASLYSAEYRRRFGRLTSSGSGNPARVERPPAAALRSPPARSAPRLAPPLFDSINDITRSNLTLETQ